MWDKSLRVDTEGPFGFPMKDTQAQQLDKILKDLPKEEPYVLTRTKAITKEVIEVDKEERTDVSWISTEDKDHQKDIVIAKGCKQDIYRLNPIVTWNHDYKQPAIGHNLWIKPAKSGATKGLKAKTHYPPQPDEWHPGTPWMPSQALSLVHLRLLPGKSVGFLPLKARRPTPEEIKGNTALYGDVRYVVEEWLLLEYSCETMPCNAGALVEASQKGLITDDLLELAGVEKPEVEEDEPEPEAVIAGLPIEKEPEPAPPPTAPYLTAEEYAKALRKTIDSYNFAGRAQEQVDTIVNRWLGRP